MIINSNPAKFLAAWATRNAIAAYREMQEEKAVTKTTEELKRTMYSWLAQVKMIDQGGAYQINSATELENSLEAYLEALRQDAQRSSAEQDDLSVRLATMTTERDSLRNKLQAFEFANKSAGELLRDALATVKRQREFIRTLYTSRKTRKSKTGTSDQSSEGNVAYDELKRFAAVQQHCLRMEIAESEAQVQEWRDNYDDQFVQNQKRQQTIVSQRKTIEALTFELVSARKQIKKRSFWRFFGAEKRTAKKLPEKMN